MAAPDADKLYSVMQMEERRAAVSAGSATGCTARSSRPTSCTTAPKTRGRWLPRLASGEMIGAIAMSEPDAGSDLQGIKSTAMPQADGNYLLHGSKTFITNGWHADLVIVVAKTEPSAGAKGTSLLLVERGMKGLNTASG